MSIRKIRRNRFRYAQRDFSWWIDNDTYLRISSVDKQFVIAYLLFDPDSIGPLLAVHGQEFPNISANEQRPIWLIPPPFKAESMGRHIENILDWCFLNDYHERYIGPIPKYVT